MKNEASVTTPAVDPAKRRYSILGLGVSAILVVVFLLQIIGAAILGKFYPDDIIPSWLFWILSFAPLYLIAVPVGLQIFKKVPSSPPEIHDLKPGRLLTAFLISMFAMYAGNLLGGFFLSLIQAIFGLSAENPLLSYTTDDSLALRILFMVILAPLIEEYIFRRQIIDRTRIYGGQTAVIASAVMFGLFHTNLFQFFYATALGLVFGYVYLRTGKLRYSVAMHMLINFMGSVLAPAMADAVSALSGTDLSDPAAIETILPQLISYTLYSILSLAATIAGLVLFCINIRKISFPASEFDLPKGKRLKTVLLNPGMLLFLVLSLLLTLFAFFS